MLREYFPKGYAPYERSGFVEDLEGFAAWLAAGGYSRQRARRHLFGLRVTLERLRQAKPRAEYTVAQLKTAFDAAGVAKHCTVLYRATNRAYQRFLSSQGRLVSVPVDTPFAGLLHQYLQELSSLRGLSPETIKQHEFTIGDFLSRIPPKGYPLSSLRSGDIDRYLALRGQAVGRHRLQHVVAQLRGFLRFCRANGHIDQSLDAIDTVRIHSDELPPRALAWPLVQALLRSIDRSSRSGWRDYAILHLMAHYGLRPNEIASLRLNSIDWNCKILHIEQRKTRSTLTLPLADRTASILRSYLLRGRPHSSHPQLFLRARCPAGPLARYAISDIFDKRAALSGLCIDGYSAYSLRHAFAMRLLNRGVGLKAIGDLLGHRDLDSTCQYLRLQIDMLRDVALPVPVQHQA